MVFQQKKGHSFKMRLSRKGQKSVTLGMGTTDEKTADRIVAFVQTMKARRRWDVVDALLAKRVSLPIAYDAYEMGRLDSLIQELASPDLQPLIAEWSKNANAKYALWGKRTMSVHFSSERMDWETPPELFAEYDAEFGFTVDVCATAGNAKVPRFYTPETDGLAQDWSRDVCWMNPPYGREIVKWMAKAHAESKRGATVVCLVPSRTDTRWWHRHAMLANERRFLEGRIRFVGAPSSAPFPSAIIVFRPAKEEERAA